MNSLKLQSTKLIYKNLLLFYTPITNYKKKKDKKNPIWIRKNKIPRNKLNQVGDRHIFWKQGDTEEENWGMEMERYSVSMDWETYYC